MFYRSQSKNMAELAQASKPIWNIKNETSIQKYMIIFQNVIFYIYSECSNSATTKASYQGFSKFI